jgi:hypothetical protein
MMTATSTGVVFGGLITVLNIGGGGGGCNLQWNDLNRVTTTSAGATIAGALLCSTVNGATGVTLQYNGSNALSTATGGAVNVTNRMAIGSALTTAGLNVDAYVQNVANEATCIRASSGVNATKIEINNSGASGKLYEIRSTNAGVWDVTDRTAAVTRFWVASAGGVYKANNSTAWDTTSDERLKDDVRDYKKGLDEICKLRPIQYRWKEGKRRERWGGVMVSVSAQALEKVFPDCVGSEASEDFEDTRTVNMHEIQFAMINAVRELSDEVKDLKKRLRLLEDD